MDDGPFLASIASQPDADGPRLVYADWLEERGRTDRAEFIRLHCELGGLEDGSARHEALTQRCEQLLEAHAEEWLGPLAEVLGQGGLNVGYWFNRGFVETLHLPADVFVSRAANVFAEHPVRNVTLTDVGPLLPELAECPYLARLAELQLSFSGPVADSAGFHALLTSPHLTRLEAFGVFSAAGAAAVDALAAAPVSSLRVLRLAATGLGDADARRLAQAPCLRTVTHLDLDNNEFGPEGAAALGAGRGFLDLETLRLDFNPLGEEGARALAAAPGLPRLSELFLRECDLGDDGLAPLCAQPIAARLTTLAVPGNEVSSAGARVLAASAWPRLAVLDLSGNPIGDDGIRFLTAAPRLAALTELSLSRCGVNGPGLRALAASAAMPRLRWLDLDEGTAAELTDDDAIALARSDRLSRLTRLSLRGRRMGAPARAVLRDRFGERLKVDG